MAQINPVSNMFSHASRSLVLVLFLAFCSCVQASTFGAILKYAAVGAGAAVVVKGVRAAAAETGGKHDASRPLGVVAGRVVGVADGDTLTLLLGGSRQVQVRLASIDAPEEGHGQKRPGQPFSSNSKRSLSSMVFGRDVTANCHDADRYGRQVCTIMVGEENVNLEQVRRGMAWANTAKPEYVRDSAVLVAQQVARKERRGLWQDANPVQPWNWRHACWDGKSGAMCASGQ